MKPDEIVARARASIGHGCKYRLGKGGNVHMPRPWDAMMECDCSGFALWCAGIERAVWYDTTRIRREALGEHEHRFEAVPISEARPGDFIVYGDRRVDGVERQGHIGVVATVGEAVAPGPVTAVHCSAGNWKRTSDAIQETGVGIWQVEQDTIIVRIHGVT